MRLILIGSVAGVFLVALRFYWQVCASVYVRKSILFSYYMNVQHFSYYAAGKHLLHLPACCCTFLFLRAEESTQV
jgi:hypothetical protein